MGVGATITAGSGGIRVARCAGPGHGRVSCAGVLAVRAAFAIQQHNRSLLAALNRALLCCFAWDAEAPTLAPRPNSPEVVGMHTTKPDLVLVSTVSALVLVFALAWGGTMVVSNVLHAQNQAQPQQQQRKSATFAGTVVGDSSDSVLGDSSSALFKLHAAKRPKPPAGKR